MTPPRRRYGMTIPFDDVPLAEQRDWDATARVASEAGACFEREEGVIQEELATVRAAAGNAGTSMRAFAKQAILDRAVDREGRVRELGIEIAQRSAELNRRLA